MHTYNGACLKVRHEEHATLLHMWCMLHHWRSMEERLKEEDQVGGAYGSHLVPPRVTGADDDWERMGQACPLPGWIICLVTC